MASNLDSFKTTSEKINSLRDKLAAALPEGFRCKVHYVHSTSKPCDALFSPLPGAEPEKTCLASHFLTISTTPRGTTAETDAAGVLVFAIEVLRYTTKHLTTLFVSKADSTGLLPQQKPSPVKTSTTTFLQWLSTKERRKHPTRKLVISLFARSQSQYLFPGSAENSNKHVLDDRQLIKWWSRVLDPIFPARDDPEASSEAAESAYDGYITVPGYEGIEIRSFLPPQNSSAGAVQHWKPGNPLPELATSRGVPSDAPSRCLLPRFPDDPKARFMRDLDDEVGISDDPASMLSPSKRKSGNWSSIRNLDRFWEAMEFRQECSSGRVVGFFWLVIRPKIFPHAGQEVDTKQAANETSQDSSVGAPSSDQVSQLDEISVTSGSPSKRRRKPLSGPIIPRQPRLKGGSSSLTATSDLAGMVDESAGEGLVLSREGYDKAMHSLMHLDFANIDIAMQSTSKWIAEVSSIGGIRTRWSLEVIGTVKSDPVANHESSSGRLQVNDLGGMIKKKKRKVEDQDTAGRLATPDVRSSTAGEERPVINILASGMVRKKPRLATS